MVAVAVLGLAGSGAIAQGVSFSGSANMGVIYHGKTTEDGNTTMEPKFQWLANFDLGISAEGTTDGGLTFGAATSIDGNGRGNGAASDVDDTTAYIGGESWKITIGDVDPASDKGKLLGDVGYDGLGVDNVAEHIGGADQNVEVSFNLGTASLAITAGQVAGSARVPAVPDSREYRDALPERYSYSLFTRTTDENIADSVKPVVNNLNNMAFYNTIHRMDDDPATDKNEMVTLITSSPEYVNTHYMTIVPENHYVVPNETSDDLNDYHIWKINGEKDDVTGTANTVEEGEDPDTADQRVNTDGYGDVSGTAVLLNIVEFANNVLPPEDKMLVSGKEGTPATPAGKQKTHWATGVSFDVGGTTLGIGIDSNKLMQTSIKADLGAFSGTLFYSQQEMDDVKSTGTGVEIGVSAGENTSINAVYAQGKTGDDTSKGFGVGVSHGLGGGASLAAGFAKVEDQTKASVGVSMSF